MKKGQENLLLRKEILENNVKDIKKNISIQEDRIDDCKKTLKLYQLVDSEYKDFIKKNNSDSLKYVIINGVTLVALSGVIGDLYNSILAFSISAMISGGLLFLGNKKIKEVEYKSIYIPTLGKNVSEEEIKGMNLSQKIYLCNLKIEEVENDISYLSSELERYNSQIDSVNKDLTKENNVVDIKEHIDVKKKVLKK